MNAFQVVALVFMGLLVVQALAGLIRERSGRRARLGWLLLWSTAATAIAWPGITMQLAQLLGIGRGADLVSYLGILAMLVGFFAVHLHLRRLNRQVTLLVRHLALEHPLEPGASSSSSPAE